MTAPCIRCGSDHVVSVPATGAEHRTVRRMGCCSCRMLWVRVEVMDAETSVASPAARLAPSLTRPHR